MDVADDVEWAVVVGAVGPQAGALDLGGIDLLGAAEMVDVAEPFPAQAAERLAKLAGLIPHDVRGKGAVGPGLIALVADALGHIDYDGDGQRVVVRGQL